MRRRAIICYLRRDAASTAYYKHASRFLTTVPIRYMSDDTLDFPTFYCPNVVAKPWCKVEPNSAQCGNQVWVNAIKCAVAWELDDFVFVENDCMYSCDWWDVSLWNALDKSEGVVAAGTPCFFTSHSDLEFSKAVNGRVLECTEAVGVPSFNVQGGPCNAVYPNGAIAAYRLDVVAEAFKPFVADPRKLECVTLAWDLAFGKWLVDRYGIGALRMVAPSTATYSCCRDYPVHSDQLREWVRTGQRTAVHSVRHEL